MAKSTSKVIKFAVIADHHVIEDSCLIEDCPGNGTEIKGLFDTKAEAKKFVKKDMQEYADEFNEYFGSNNSCDDDEIDEDEDDLNGARCDADDDEGNLELDFKNMCIIDHDAHASIHEWHIQKIEL